MKRKLNTSYLISLGISIALAFVIGGIILAASGHDPFNAYAEMIKGAFSNWRHVGDTLEYAMVLCLCGLACVIGARVGIFNVGGEGQLLLGAIMAAQIGVWLNGMSAWVVIPCAVVGACVTGAVYAFIPGILKVKLKVNEVITTIMLNTVAQFLCQYLAKGPWKNSNNNIVAGTQNLDKAYWLGKLTPGSNLSTAIFASAALVVLIWYIMNKTATGYEMKLTGENPRFAFFSGLKTDRIVLVAMLLSGALCGLVGMFRVYGAEHIFKSSVSKEYYFEGLMVAMIARYDPLTTVFMSLFFAILKIGAAGMESNAGVPNQIYLIIQTVVIFAVAAESGIAASIRDSRERRRAKLAAKQRHEGGGAA